MPINNKNIHAHLVIEPSLLLSAVFICDGLVLSADLIQNLVQVLLRSGVYLHVNVSRQLRSHRCQILQAYEVANTLGLILLFSFEKVLREYLKKSATKYGDC